MLIAVTVLDYSTGFGGKYGVEHDKQDDSALGWDHQEKLAQHESQKGTLGLINFTACKIYFVHFECHATSLC